MRIIQNKQQRHFNKPAALHPPCPNPHQCTTSQIAEYRLEPHE